MARTWIELTPEQITLIRKTYSWFKDNEVELDVSYEKVDQSVGDYDRAYSLEANYIAAIFYPPDDPSIKHVLFHGSVEVPNPFFSLTDEQLKLLSI